MRFPRLAGCLCFLLCGCCFAQLQFAPVILEGPRAKLEVSGADTNRILFESSRNLSNWTVLFLATPTNGTFNLVDPGEERPAAQQFYRARTLTPPASSGKRTVIPNLDANRTVSTLADEDGTVSYLFADNNVRFTLTFPPRTAAEPQIVTMTQVTNLVGLPFSSGIIGAVQLDLGDLTLFGPPTLEMSLGVNTNIEQRHVVSFACNSDGTRFRLTLNRVETNTVLLVPLGSGIYGSCLATTAELEQMFRQNGPLTTSSVSPPKVGLAAVRPSGGFLSASEICFPERVAQAVKADRLIREELEILTELLAGARVQGLEGQLAAPVDPSTLLQEVGRISCLFFENMIKPILGAVENNCALLTVLSRHTLALSRQVQLLGDENCPALLMPLTTLPICSGARACFEEIKQCCAEHPELREQFRIDLLSLARQQALLGIEGQDGCFDLSDADVQELLEGCNSTLWTGEVTRREKHESFFDSPTQASHITTTSRYDGYIGPIATVAGHAFGFELSGQSSYKQRRVSITKENCRNPFKPTPSCGPTYDVQETIAKGRRTGLVGVTVDDKGTNSTYILTILIDFDYGRGVPGLPETTVHYRNYFDCDDCSEGSIYEKSQSTYISPVIFPYAGKTADPNFITGSVTSTIPQANGEIVLSWKLTRSKPQ